MRQRYSFIIFIFLFITVLGWWGGSIPGSSSSSHLLGAILIKPSKEDLVRNQITPPDQGLDLELSSESLRRELLEALDRLVTYELYYRSVYGRFTKMISRVGLKIPLRLTQAYQMQVVEANTDQLLISAYTESDGEKVEQISIDQNYEVRANFKFPMPRPEYLRVQALKHLRQLRDLNEGQSIDERGIFKGYFRFDVRKDSEGRRVAFAVGVRPPVVGMQLEQGSMQGNSHVQIEDPQLDSSDFTEMENLLAIGQGTGADVMSSDEVERLAQKIFYGEMGRYARTLTELSRIANFHFVQNEKEQKLNSDKKNQETDRHISSVRNPLEIEPIPSEKDHK